MTDENDRLQRLEHELAELRRKQDALVKIVRSIDDQIRLVSSIRSDDSKSIQQLLRESEQHYRNDRWLYERVMPMFRGMFPDQDAYEQEFDRVLGTGLKPEEPKKPPGG
jgi:hypothetical protein